MPIHSLYNFLYVYIKERWKKLDHAKKSCLTRQEPLPERVYLEIEEQFRNGVTNKSQKSKEKQGEGNFLVGIEHFQTASINNQTDTTLFHLPR